MAAHAHLSVRDLRKHYDATLVLNEIAFDIPQGEIAALIGPNGAGKSTLFAILSGALRADGGTILLNGEGILGLSPESVARRGIGRTFQTSQPYRSLRVLDSLLLIQSAAASAWNRMTRPLGKQATETALAVLEDVGLTHLADAPSAALSYGDVKRLELAMALVRAPSLLLMDEPTAGMAPGERSAFMELVRRRSAACDMTVLFTEHDMATVFGFAARVLVLDRGRMIADGPPEAVRADTEVRRAYLGNVPPTKTL